MAAPGFVSCLITLSTGQDIPPQLRSRSESASASTSLPGRRRAWPPPVPLMGWVRAAYGWNLLGDGPGGIRLRRAARGLPKRAEGVPVFGPSSSASGQVWAGVDALPAATGCQVRRSAHRGYLFSGVASRGAGRGGIGCCSPCALSAMGPTPKARIGRLRSRALLHGGLDGERLLFSMRAFRWPIREHGHSTEVPAGC